MKENYKITFQEAKQIDGFKIVWNKPYQSILKTLTTSSDHSELSDLDCMCCMEFKNIDIEFMCYGVCDVTCEPCVEKLQGRPDIGFFVCVNTKDYGWCSHGFSDLEVSLNEEILGNKSLLEESMFYAMMNYAQVNELYWSELNE